jgi:rhomboid protease GluP
MAPPAGYRVKETLLSQKPRKGSLEVAAIVLIIVQTTSLMAWRNGDVLLPTLAATPESVFRAHQYWRLLTAIAVHADVMHFVSNALFLAPFAYLLYGYFGFWVFPVASLAMAALVNGISVATYPQGSALLGASGLVYWMAGFWLTAYLLVERSVNPGKRILRAVCLGLLVLAPSTFEANVSYRTHGIGLALGIASALLYFATNRQALRQAEVLEAEPLADDLEETPPF